MLAVKRAFPDRAMALEDFPVDTKKISRPPSAPASPKFNARDDGLAPDDLTDSFGDAHLNDTDDDEHDAAG